MSSETNRTKWLVVLGSTIALMVSNGPVILFSFGVFLKPISEEYGWSRGEMSLGVTIALILGGLATPGFGILIDKWSIQRVTLIVITLFAISFGLISLTPPNIVVFISLYAIAGLLAGGHAPLPYAKSISGWFEHSRGLALGIAMAGVGIGIAILPQIARLLMDIVGWRHAYVLIGAIMWLVSFPAVLFLVKDPVITVDKARANAAQRIADELSFAVYGRDFWLIAVAAFLVVTAVNGISAHFIALLTDRGVPVGIAAPMLAAMGVATIAGRLMSGYLLDRVFAPYLAAAVFLVPLIGIVLLLAGVTSTALVICAAVCFGLSLGAEVDIIGFLVGRYFGLHRYGEIYGYIFAAFTVGSGVGPYLMGVSFDKTGSYNTTLIFFCGALIVASILIALLGEYRYPERRERTVVEAQAMAVET